MPTYTAFTTLPGRTPAETLGTALEALDPAPTGVGVFEIEDDSGLWEVAGYFTEKPDDIALDLLAAAHGAQGFVISEVPETDWVAHVRRELSPVEAGRFFVYGSHDADKVPEGCHPLLIEAAMAFGTGHHGTTLGCLVAFDALLNDGFEPLNAVDIGCGTAVLAMAAARAFPHPVLASDIDEVAVDVAKTNLVANGLADQVTCVEAAGFAHPELNAAAPFDLVFANILKGPLIALADDMRAAMKPGGYAILSGILNDQAQAVIDHYAQSGFDLANNRQFSDWTTLTLIRR